MKVKEWLDKVAYIASSDIPDDNGDVYYSKYDNSYITRVEMEESIKFLADRDITDELTHGVGFSPTKNKWYGWSHRAIYGFTIGSTCKKGDCHYRPSNIKEEIEKAKNFWHDEEFHIWTTAYLDDGKIIVEWLYNDKSKNPDCRNKIKSCEWDYNPNNFGKGEWVAQTMDDAKQMAIDFHEGIS